MPPKAPPKKVPAAMLQKMRQEHPNSHPSVAGPKRSKTPPALAPPTKRPSSKSPAPQSTNSADATASPSQEPRAVAKAPPASPPPTRAKSPPATAAPAKKAPPKSAPPLHSTPTADSSTPPPGSSYSPPPGSSAGSPAPAEEGQGGLQRRSSSMVRSRPRSGSTTAGPSRTTSSSRLPPTRAQPQQQQQPSGQPTKNEPPPINNGTSPRSAADADDADPNPTTHDAPPPTRKLDAASSIRITTPSPARDPSPLPAGVRSSSPPQPPTLGDVAVLATATILGANFSAYEYARTTGDSTASHFEALVRDDLAGAVRDAVPTVIDDIEVLVVIASAPLRSVDVRYVELGGEVASSAPGSAPRRQAQAVIDDAEWPIRVEATITGMRTEAQGRAVETAVAQHLRGRGALRGALVYSRSALGHVLSGGSTSLAVDSHSVAVRMFVGSSDQQQQPPSRKASAASVQQTSAAGTSSRIDATEVESVDHPTPAATPTPSASGRQPASSSAGRGAHAGRSGSGKSPAASPAPSKPPTTVDMHQVDEAASSSAAGRSERRSPSVLSRGSRPAEAAADVGPTRGFGASGSRSGRAYTDDHRSATVAAAPKTAQVRLVAAFVACWFSNFSNDVAARQAFSRAVVQDLRDAGFVEGEWDVLQCTLKPTAAGGTAVDASLYATSKLGDYESRRLVVDASAAALRQYVASTVDCFPVARYTYQEQFGGGSFEQLGELDLSLTSVQGIPLAAGGSGSAAAATPGVASPSPYSGTGFAGHGATAPGYDVGMASSSPGRRIPGTRTPRKCPEVQSLVDLRGAAGYEEITATGPAARGSAGNVMLLSPSQQPMHARASASPAGRAAGSPRPRDDPAQYAVHTSPAPSQQVPAQQQQAAEHAVRARAAHSPHVLRQQPSFKAVEPEASLEEPPQQRHEPPSSDRVEHTAAQPAAAAASSVADVSPEPSACVRMSFVVPSYSFARFSEARPAMLEESVNDEAHRVASSFVSKDEAATRVRVYFADGEVTVNDPYYADTLGIVADVDVDERDATTLVADWEATLRDYRAFSGLRRFIDASHSQNEPVVPEGAWRADLFVDGANDTTLVEVSAVHPDPQPAAAPAVGEDATSEPPPDGDYDAAAATSMPPTDDDTGPVETLRFAVTLDEVDGDDFDDLAAADAQFETLALRDVAADVLVACGGRRVVSRRDIAVRLVPQRVGRQSMLQAEVEVDIRGGLRVKQSVTRSINAWLAADDAMLRLKQLCWERLPATERIYGVNDRLVVWK